MGSMIIWNTYGLGGKDKKKRCARNLVRKLNALEMKLENINEYIINLTWD
jgi:hypothetical protein